MKIKVGDRIRAAAGGPIGLVTKVFKKTLWVDWRGIDLSKSVKKKDCVLVISKEEVDFFKKTGEFKYLNRFAPE